MPVQPYATLHWFKKRIQRFLPPELKEGILLLNTPDEIKTVLDAVLQAPLSYDAEKDGLPGDILWWFRGWDSNIIRDYTLSMDNVLALHMQGYQRHMAVVQVDVVFSEVLDMNFLYLTCDPLPSKSSPHQEQAGEFTEAWEVEYYIPSSGRTMQYDEFDHDAPYADEAIDLYFHTTPYNIFISPKECRLNNTGKGGRLLRNMSNALLAGEIDLTDFIKILSNYPTCGYTQNLIRQSKL